MPEPEAVVTDETQQTPWTSITTEPSLKELLQKARREMTPEEIFEQRVSWVYDNLAMSNPDVTREMVREVALAELPDKRLLTKKRDVGSGYVCDCGVENIDLCRGGKDCRAEPDAQAIVACIERARKGENDDDWLEDDWAE